MSVPIREEAAVSPAGKRQARLPVQAAVPERGWVGCPLRAGAAQALRAPPGVETDPLEISP